MKTTENSHCLVLCFKRGLASLQSDSLLYSGVFFVHRLLHVNNSFPWLLRNEFRSEQSTSFDLKGVRTFCVELDQVAAAVLEK